MSFAFRPHHFLCTLGFQGKGYSPDFVENYGEIASALEKNPNLSIRVVESEDSICRACPHQTDRGCAEEDKISLLDGRHLQVLKIKGGEIFSWAHMKQRLKTHMTLEAFHRACAGCVWKSLGVCEAALRALRDDEKTLA